MTALPNVRHCTAGALLLLMQAAPASAQQARTDSTALRADYRNLNELLAALPLVSPPTFDEERALWLGSLPLACLDRLQPRTPGRGGGGGGRAVGAASDSAARAGRAGGGGRANTGADYFWVASYRLIEDHNRTRAFWGCTDWHSAASSTWVTVRLLKTFPRFGLQELAREKMNDHLGASNLEGELAFFRGAAGAFERPYGYAWLLKLHAELRGFPDSQAMRWTGNVAPLAAWMADSLLAHLRALERPVRTGGPTNTALTLSLALDYADAAADTRLQTALAAAAHKFYAADKACNTAAEAAAVGRSAAPARAGGAARVDSAGPGRGRATGSAAPTSNDVLSPCLSEAALMARVLEPAAYVRWLDAFLPPLTSGRFAALTEIPAADATGNERARRAALAFQRAYAMEGIARTLPRTDARTTAWRRLSALHADRGFELMRGDLAGTHWVPAYALLYLSERRMN
jgi:hypothetical protein